MQWLQPQQRRGPPVRGWATYCTAPYRRAWTAVPAPKYPYCGTCARHTCHVHGRAPPNIWPHLMASLSARHRAPQHVMSNSGGACTAHSARIIQTQNTLDASSSSPPVRARRNTHTHARTHTADHSPPHGLLPTPRKNENWSATTRSTSKVATLAHPHLHLPTTQYTACPPHTAPTRCAHAVNTARKTRARPECTKTACSRMDGRLPVRHRHTCPRLHAASGAPHEPACRLAGTVAPAANSCSSEVCTSAVAAPGGTDRHAHGPGPGALREAMHTSGSSLHSIIHLCCEGCVRIILHNMLDTHLCGQGARRHGQASRGLARHPPLWGGGWGGCAVPPICNCATHMHGGASDGRLHSQAPTLTPGRHHPACPRRSEHRGAGIAVTDVAGGRARATTCRCRACLPRRPRPPVPCAIRYPKSHVFARTRPPRTVVPADTLHAVCERASERARAHASMPSRLDVAAGGSQFSVHRVEYHTWPLVVDAGAAEAAGRAPGWPASWEVPTPLRLMIFWG